MLHAMILVLGSKDKKVFDSDRRLTTSHNGNGVAEACEE